MSVLGEDELGLILNWVSDPDDRKSFSQVCKQWWRVAGLNQSTIRVLEPDAIIHLIPRFPNLLAFETSKWITDTEIEFLAQICPRLEVINLNFKTPRQISYEFVQAYEGSMLRDVSGQGLCALANGCPKLSKVLLRRRNKTGDAGLVPLVNKALYLTHLDLGYCSSITDQTLEAVGSASSISILNLQGCSLITDCGLSFLANGSCSKTIKELVLAECDRITDLGVSLLKQMCCLEELNLCDCGPKVTDIGGVEIAAIHALKKLDLSWLVNVSDPTIVALAENCLNLEALDLTGCELVTGAGIRAFSSHIRLKCLVLCSCFGFGQSDVTHIVLECRSLKSIVVDKRIRMWFLQMQERISRVVWYR
ncbi:hypothetical protein M0R45_029925 [Rubus argutus]|uniref:Uncharacterized protein n=1 Tax=Rubus argutus TaxID=59490 RepID=A0AAW1WBM8_RUBAR